MLLERWHVIRRAIDRGYDVHGIWPCFVRWDHDDVWEVDTDHPAYPRARGPEPKPVAVSGDGVGTELKSLLALLGFRTTPGCGCLVKAQAMNDRGIEWCRDNVAMIVGWLEDEARTRRVPFVRAVATLLVKRAIRNAERRLTSLPSSG